MSYIDTHCHLNLLEKNDSELVSILTEASLEGIQGIIQVATGYESSVWNQDLVRTYSERSDIPKLFYTIGIHPESVDNEEEERQISDLILASLDDPAFIAIGECGLDFFHSAEKQQEQERAFEVQVELAKKTGLPLVLHLRDDRFYNPDRLQAMKRSLEIVRSAGDIRGVLHCFTYSYDEALPFVDLGWKVSFSGIVTYKNASVVQEAAANLPLHCLMTETDAPYLSPVPMRGKMNTPAFVKHTADFITDLRSENDKKTKEEIRNILLDNAREFIGWKHNA